MLLYLLSAALGLSAGPGEPADALEAALRQRYPEVIRWAIRPLGGAPPSGDSDGRIVTLGPRSALQVHGRVYWYAVEGFEPVVSAAHVLAAGQATVPGDGVVEEQDVVGAGCEPLTSVSALEGARARRLLHPNEIICASMIEPKPLVARGDAVTVRYVGPGLVLTTKGVAQSDGRSGDSLMVRNPGSRDLFRAVVSGPGEVTIHE
jgi:flagella basal body P-ring formation protein FlgA